MKWQVILVWREGVMLDHLPFCALPLFCRKVYSFTTFMKEYLKLTVDVLDGYN